MMQALYSHNLTFAEIPLTVQASSGKAKPCIGGMASNEEMPSIA